MAVFTVLSTTVSVELELDESSVVTEDVCCSATMSLDDGSSSAATAAGFGSVLPTRVQGGGDGVVRDVLVVTALGELDLLLLQFSALPKAGSSITDNLAGLARTGPDDSLRSSSCLA